MGDIMFSWKKPCSCIYMYIIICIFYNAIMHCYKRYQGKSWSKNDESDLYKSLQQTLCERTKGTTVFWRFVLGF